MYTKVASYIKLDNHHKRQRKYRNKILHFTLHYCLYTFMTAQ